MARARRGGGSASAPRGRRRAAGPGPAAARAAARPAGPRARGAPATERSGGGGGGGGAPPPPGAGGPPGGPPGEPPSGPGGGGGNFPLALLGSAVVLPGKDLWDFLRSRDLFLFLACLLVPCLGVYAKFRRVDKYFAAAFVGMCLGYAPGVVLALLFVFGGVRF